MTFLLFKQQHNYKTQSNETIKMVNQYHRKISNH